MRSEKRLLLDVSRLVWRAWKGLLPTGIDRTCLAYVRHYRKRAHAVLQRGGIARVLGLSASEALFDSLLAPTANIRRQIAYATIAGCLNSVGESQNGKFYLNVGHTGLDHPGHRSWVEQAGVRPIYFIHDLIPLTHPEYCRDGEAVKHRLRMRAALDLGVGVIGNSQSTIDELRSFASQEGRLAMPPALVAPLGLDVTAQFQGQRSIFLRPGSPYFVMLGTIEPRKNHLLILTIWAELARKLGTACPQLVIVGRRGWECEQVIDMLDRNEAVRGHVIELADCADHEVARLLTHARALLFPSFAEGYGLPLLEALAHGAPVIASRLPAFIELAHDIPDYRSPIDGIGWAAIIEDYSQSGSEMRKAQLKRMTEWRSPSWDEHYLLVDQWLDRLSGGSC